MAAKKDADTKILIFDTETGGFDPSKVSCLTAGFVVADIKTGKITDKLYIECNEADDVYRVSAGALRVNKLDIVKHDKNAIGPEEAVGKIVDFIKKNFKGKPIPGGQNTPFDINFLKELFRKGGADYEDFFHYAYHDTMPILRFLAALGLIPAGAQKLDGARKHFDIKTKRGKAHNALDDCEATAMLFAKLSEFFVGGAAEDADDGEEEEEETKKSSKKTTKKSSKKKDDEKKSSKKTSKKKDEEEEEDDEDFDLDDEEELDLDDDEEGEGGDEEDEEEDEDETPDELEDDEDEDEEDDEDEDEEEEGDDDEDEDDDDLDDWGDEDDDED